MPEYVSEKPFSVAIDGPSGAGKSTLSRRLAEHFGFVYVDTGALYRALGLFVLRHGVDACDEAAVVASLPSVSLSLTHGADGQRVVLSGEDVTDAIRAHEVSRAASDVSAHGAVRAFLLDLQRAFARESSVVMDGRDIGTVVLPDADLKIFLTASPEDRARRRFEELSARGMDVDFLTILADQTARDQNDASRPIAPLKPAEDAILLDTTGNTFETSLGQLIQIVRGAYTPCSFT